jgi:hypothetical protein
MLAERWSWGWGWDWEDDAHDTTGPWDADDLPSAPDRYVVPSTEA